MRAVHPNLAERLQTRACLRCGYRGPELQGDRPEPPLVCPACGEDLYSRPPRSYAELEGLDEAGAWSNWTLSGRLENRLLALLRRIMRALGRAIVQRR
jgi:hypothetical protein